MIWPGDILSVLLAVVLGAAIGLEREASGKAAGLRTNVLICLGAAVFTIISRQMGRGGDASMTRIAAQIVTGVGFIGAGAIIRDRAGIYGLTTAATIWLVASIGMACGAGLHILAVTSTRKAAGSLHAKAQTTKAAPRTRQRLIQLIIAQAIQRVEVGKISLSVALFDFVELVCGQLL
ncbi:MAG: MgtC/SapB family protein [Planctomycetota bacterium]|jgi:putative Mg2+ transporter-C (MgtC) family protein